MLSDDPGESVLSCPVCESGRIEDIAAVEGLGALTYRCQKCGAEFDETGGWVVP